MTPMSKTMSLSMVLTSAILISSANSWLLIWVLMEINSMSFIFFASSSQGKEAMLTYFIIQAVASTLILFQMAMEKSILPHTALSAISNIIITTAMMMKLGMPPIHQWMIKLCTLLSHEKLGILLSIQKFPPLMVLAHSTTSNLPILMLLPGTVTACFSQLSASKINMILVFSSIIHTTWASTLSKISPNMTFWYLTIYSVMIILLMNYLKMAKANVISNQEIFKKDPNILIGMLSLAGMPPLTGFSLKWVLVLSLLRSSNLALLSIFVILMAVVSAFSYTRTLVMSSANANNTSLIFKSNTTSKVFIAMQVLPTIPIILMV